jgi:DDE family transposase
MGGSGVTTLMGTNRTVVRFYNQRGTAEQWIKEGKTATHWTRLSCHRFRANEVRLLLGVIAYNLGNLLRRLVLPVAIQNWSLTSLQQRLFKTGGRLIRHARYFILQLAESHLTPTLFRQILGRIERSRGIRRDREGRTRTERETERSWREYLSAGWSPRAKLRAMGHQPRGRRDDSLCDAFRTAEGARGASHGLFSNARERGRGSKSQIPAQTCWRSQKALHENGSESAVRHAEPSILPRVPTLSRDSPRRTLSLTTCSSGPIVQPSNRRHTATWRSGSQRAQVLRIVPPFRRYTPCRTLFHVANLG